MKIGDVYKRSWSTTTPFQTFDFLAGYHYWLSPTIPYFALKIRKVNFFYRFNLINLFFEKIETLKVYMQMISDSFSIYFF